MTKPICLIIGVGDGTGAAIACKRLSTKYWMLKPSRLRHCGVATPWSRNLPVQGLNIGALNQPRLAWSFDIEICPFADS